MKNKEGNTILHTRGSIILDSTDNNLYYTLPDGVRKKIISGTSDTGSSPSGYCYVPDPYNKYNYYDYKLYNSNLIPDSDWYKYHKFRLYVRLKDLYCKFSEINKETVKITLVQESFCENSKDSPLLFYDLYNLRAFQSSSGYGVKTIVIEFSFTNGYELLKKHIDLILYSCVIESGLYIDEECTKPYTEPLPLIDVGVNYKYIDYQALNTYDYFRFEFPKTFFSIDKRLTTVKRVSLRANLRNLSENAKYNVKFNGNLEYSTNYGITWDTVYVLGSDTPTSSEGLVEINYPDNSTVESLGDYIDEGPQVWFRGIGNKSISGISTSSTNEKVNRFYIEANYTNTDDTSNTINVNLLGKLSTIFNYPSEDSLKWETFFSPPFSLGISNYACQWMLYNSPIYECRLKWLSKTVPGIYSHMFDSSKVSICTESLPGDHPYLQTSRWDVSSYCYSYMFNESDITYIPYNFLPSKLTEVGCYESMFSGCKNLHLNGRPNTPSDTYFTNYLILPATDISDSAYKYMFSKSSIVCTPIMSLTNVGNLGCMGMFQECKNLIDASNTKLENVKKMNTQSFANMFSECSVLKIPTCLPSNYKYEFPTDCFKQMYYNCSKLLIIQHNYTNNISKQGGSSLFLSAVLNKYITLTNFFDIKSIATIHSSFYDTSSTTPDTSNFAQDLFTGCSRHIYGTDVIYNGVYLSGYKTDN